MNTLVIRTIIFSFIFVFTCSFSIQAETKPLEASAKAAEEWLHLIDAKKYGESWDAGSVTFKLTVPKNHWITLMESIRKPLGSVDSRKILEQRPAKDPKGLPRGDYMVVFYDTSFSSREVAHELVTLILESDGEWKVLTYQVQ